MLGFVLRKHKIYLYVYHSLTIPWQDFQDKTCPSEVEIFVFVFAFDISFSLSFILKGIDTNAGNAWSATGSAVDLFLEIVWCRLYHQWVHCTSAWLPQQRSLMEQFFCGTRRNRGRWLFSVYRSMTQCCEMGPPEIETVHWPAPV